MGNLRTILVLCVVTISLLSYSVCAKKSSKSKRKSSVKHHKEGKLARLISKVDRQLGGKKNISYIVNPLKYSNYVEQFKKIRNLGEEVRCKLRGSCAEDLKRFQITHGGARHFRIKNKVGQKKSMQSFSSVNMPDTSNQVIQQDRLMSTEGPNPSQFMNSAYSNQPNAADFGQQPQMNIQLPKTPESVPMSPQGIPTMDQMQNAANDASIQNSIQSKMNFMDSANSQMMPFGPGPAGGMGGPGGPGGGMGMDGMRSSGHGHAKFVRHHGPMKGHIMDDMPGRESSHMNEEEEQNMHDDHHHHDHPSSEPSRFSDDNNKDEEEDSEDEKNDHPSNKSSSSRFHADNNRDDERDPKEMHEMHEMPNNREFSSMNDESKDEAERMRMSDGPRGVPNTDTASVSDEDIYKAEGVQPNEMKDLHNFLSHNHKYKPKDEEEESIRENEEFNENERRHGANVATSNDREDKDYRGDSRSPDKDDRSEEEEEHTGHHSHGSRNEPDEDLEDKHHSSHHHHGGHEHGHGGVGEPVGHAIGGPMGAEPGMGPPPGIGMGMGMGGPGAMGAGMGPVAGMGMGPDVGMGGPPGMGPGASMPGAGMEGMGPGVGMVKPGGVEVPTLNNLMGGGVPLTGMADDTLGGPPGRPNVDFDNQGRFVSDNQRSMMESNSDYDVPKTGRKNTLSLHGNHEGESEKEGEGNEEEGDDDDGDDDVDKVNKQKDKQYDNQLEEKMIKDAEKEAEEEEAKDEKDKKEKDEVKQAGTDNEENNDDREDNKLEAEESEEDGKEKDGKTHEREERCILHGDDGTDLDDGDKDGESRCNIHKYKNMHGKGAPAGTPAVAHIDKEIHNLGDGIHTGDVILSDVSTEKILVPMGEVQLPMHGGGLKGNQTMIDTTQAHKRTRTPAFASLWKDYMLTTQSQLADRDPSANNRGHIHHPHHGKKFKVRKTGKELHRWKKSYVEDDEPGSKRSDAPAAPNPSNTTAPQSNVTMDNATQTTAQISNTTTTSNKTAAEAATPTIDQSNSTTLTNNNTIDSPQNKTVESTKNETKPAKKSDVKNKPDTLPPIYLTIKNGEKLLVVHPTAEFINSLPKINFTEEEDAVKRTKIDNEIPTYISPLRSHEPDENESDEDNDDEDDDEDDEGGETKSNIVARSNIFTKTGNNKGFISVPVISPDPNGKIGLMLNTARDKVYSEGETKPIQRSFGDQGNNFGTPLGGQGGERRDGHNFSPEYNQQIQNVPNQFDQSSSPSATHKGFYKTQPDESMPMIPKDIQTLYRQYQPGDGKNSFQYAPSQDEVREELNYVEHKNENTNDREDGGMSPFMSQQDPQMSAENDYNNRIAEPNSAPINPNRDSPSQWDQGDQHMSDGSRRSDVPIVFTKEHVGFGPITVEAKTADAPPDDPALDE